MKIRRIAVAGMGLIGGSIHKAALRAGLESVPLHHGDVDGLDGAEAVFVCLPPDAVIPWLREKSARLAPGAAVVDIAGVKTRIVREAAALPKSGWTFVGGHPMAGKEVSGYENSCEDLFDGRSMIFTPAGGEWSEKENGDRAALEELVRAFGFSQVVVASPERHDEMIAFTSQLGHVIASAYMQDPLAGSAVGFSAGSYANMSRIATADPDVWTSLYLEDREPLLRALDGLTSRLAAFRDALFRGDADALKAFISAGASAKRADIAARCSTR